NAPAQTLTIEITGKNFYVSCAKVWSVVDPKIQQIQAMQDPPPPQPTPPPVQAPPPTQTSDTNYPVNPSPAGDQTSTTTSPTTAVSQAPPGAGVLVGIGVVFIGAVWLIRRVF